MAGGWGGGQRRRKRSPEEVRFELSMQKVDHLGELRLAALEQVLPCPEQQCRVEQEQTKRIQNDGHPCEPLGAVVFCGAALNSDVDLEIPASV